MKNLLEKYRGLPKKYQYGILVGAFVLGILILPSTIVWAAATVAAYKLITKKVWRYVAVSILALFTFFAGVLWIAGDTVPEESIAPTEEAAQAQQPVEAETVPEEPQGVEEPAIEENRIVEVRSEPSPAAAPQQSAAPAQASSPAASEPTPTPAPAPSTGGAWYTSSHFSAKYYYHASCDGWQGLSPTYLQSYATEAALRAAHPNHTLHPECSP